MIILFFFRKYYVIVSSPMVQADSNCSRINYFVDIDTDWKLFLN